MAIEVLSWPVIFWAFRTLPRRHGTQLHGGTPDRNFDSCLSNIKSKTENSHLVDMIKQSISSSI